MGGEGKGGTVNEGEGIVSLSEILNTPLVTPSIAVFRMMPFSNLYELFAVYCSHKNVMVMSPTVRKWSRRQTNTVEWLQIHGDHTSAEASPEWSSCTSNDRRHLDRVDDHRGAKPRSRRRPHVELWRRINADCLLHQLAAPTIGPHVCRPFFHALQTRNLAIVNRSRSSYHGLSCWIRQ